MTDAVPHEPTEPASGSVWRARLRWLILVSGLAGLAIITRQALADDESAIPGPVASAAALVLYGGAGVSAARAWSVLLGPTVDPLEVRGAMYESQLSKYVPGGGVLQAAGQVVLSTSRPAHGPPERAWRGRPRWCSRSSPASSCSAGSPCWVGSATGPGSSRCSASRRCCWSNRRRLALGADPAPPLHRPHPRARSPARASARSTSPSAGRSAACCSAPRATPRSSSTSTAPCGPSRCCPPSWPAGWPASCSCPSRPGWGRARPSSSR